MAITISGSGITSANIADGTIVNADVNDVAASKLTGALPAISGASLTNLPAGGKVLQIQKSDFDATISWTTYNDVIGSGVTITPSSTSSKIYVMIESMGTQSGGANNGTLRLWVQSSEMASRQAYGGCTTRGIMPFALNTLHSPNTTSPVTYYAQWRKTNNGGLGSHNYGVKGTITVMEIAQ